ncbi:putative phage tail protein [Clostridium uliginosum]|uniref:Uncharacterized protein n=1 Tax=Clostridium uliginosum TaxID=119641 RepID=A0A1I1KS98_9CLOT|nr:putative phage tail protein [Clostridium uliginosum]SFC63714.1 hypothetical protein SAMN05421842_106136 [Clostridium uliginosum]
MLLKDYVPFFISQVKEISNIYNVQQIEIDKLNLDVKDLLNQCFVESTTWGIKYWEEFVGIIPDSSKKIENRRSRVLARLRGEGTTTIEVIKQIAKSFINDIEVIENNKNYSFEVDLKTYNAFPNILDPLYTAIEEVKPAHLGVDYKLISIVENELYFGGTRVTGEIITVYPWTPNNIQSNLKVNTQIIHNIGLENLTIYPKEVK